MVFIAVLTPLALALLAMLSGADSRPLFDGRPEGERFGVLR